MKINDPYLAIIIPAINEAEGIGLTLQELQRVLVDPLYLVIDGGSVDGTVDIAEKLGAEVVQQHGVGKGQAIAQALRRVNSGARYIVFIDADFTYPAQYIPQMVAVLENNSKVGMMLGNRFSKRIEPNAMGNSFYLGNRYLAFMQRLMNGIALRDPLTGLRVVRKVALQDWRPKSQGFDVEVELNNYVNRKGYDIVEIPIHYRKRLGQKKLKLRHGTIILRRILTEMVSSNMSDGQKRSTS